MPGFDRTGPKGQGSQTGRKQGKCGNEDNSSMEELPHGRGLGRGLSNRLRLGRDQNIEPGQGRRMGRGKEKGIGRGNS